MTYRDIIQDYLSDTVVTSKQIEIALKIAVREAKYRAIEIILDYDDDTPLGELKNAICKDIKNIELND